MREDLSARKTGIEALSGDGKSLPLEFRGAQQVSFGRLRAMADEVWAPVTESDERISEVRRAYLAAADFLDGRDQVLEEVAPHFRKVAEAISSAYSYQVNKKQDKNGSLQDGLTRYAHLGLTQILPDQMRKTWFDHQSGEEIFKSQLFQVFGWSFNRMIWLQNEGDRDDIGFISRGTAGGEPVPYPLHTHIDVPYALMFYDLDRPKLSIALAAAHDAFEEGSLLRYKDGEWYLERVDLQELVERFPQDQVGTQLAVGIAALTETPFEQMEASFSADRLAEFKNRGAQLVKEQLPGLDIDEKHLNKIHGEDPLVFGGLALQVREVVRELMSSYHDQDHQEALPDRRKLQLAESIISVEIGDRMSDIAALGRHLDWYEGEPDVARYKILAYVSRMLNMHEKLSDSIALLGEDRQQRFTNAMEGYLSLTLKKLEGVNARLEALGLDAIEIGEIEQFHQNVFQPIQSSAEQLMGGFISERVEEILGPMRSGSN